MTLASLNRRHQLNTTRDPRRGLLRAAQLFMAVAAYIHIKVIPEHLQEWLPAGLFFIAISALQAALVVSLLRRPGLPTLLASIWSSVAIILVYLWSRTIGIPFMPEHADHAAQEHAGHAVGGHGNGVPIFPESSSPHGVESVGSLDLAALGAEMLVIALVVSVLPTRAQGRVSNVLLVLGAALLVLRAVGVLN